MLTIIKNILLLPLVLIKDIFRSSISGGAKFGYLILTLIFFFATWYNSYRSIYSETKYFLYNVGVTDKLTYIHVSGESMLPTINDGSQVQLHSPKKYSIQRGDIVSFRNQNTGYANYLKRIVGLPGESISIKNGYVSINGKFLDENYALNNSPTYGNTFINECSVYVIPQNHYLALGDNRTVSFDSRAIGFVDQNDINGVIKTSQKETFISEEGKTNILQTKIDNEVLLSKINEFRKTNNSDPLTINPTLNEVAQLRAESIKTFFSDWKNKSPSIDSLLKEKNYRYNLIHEFVTFGYLDETAIVNQIKESPLDKTNFLSNNIMEIGVGNIEMNTQDCTFPIISLVTAWPSVPTYNQEVIDSWVQEANDTKTMLNELQGLVGTKSVDQNQLQQLISQLAQLSVKSEEISQKINNKEWVDAKELETYQNLVKEFENKVKSITPSNQLPSTPTTKTQPTATPAVKNSSFEQKTIENGATAKINSITQSGDKIKVKITFANISNKSVTVYPIRLTMKSQTHGTGAEPGYLNLTLNASELRTFDFEYMKIPNPPYTFAYLNSGGDSVTLATYNP